MVSPYPGPPKYKILHAVHVAINYATELTNWIQTLLDMDSGCWLDSPNNFQSDPLQHISHMLCNHYYNSIVLQRKCYCDFMTLSYTLSSSMRSHASRVGVIDECIPIDGILSSLSGWDQHVSTKTSVDPLPVVSYFIPVSYSGLPILGRFYYYACIM